MGIDLPVCACLLDGGQMAMLGEKGQIGGGLALRVNVICHLAGRGVSAPDAYGFSTLGTSDGERGVTVRGKVGHWGNLSGGSSGRLAPPCLGVRNIRDAML